MEHITLGGCLIRLLVNTELYVLGTSFKKKKRKRGVKGSALEANPWRNLRLEGFISFNTGGLHEDSSKHKVGDLKIHLHIANR